MRNKIKHITIVGGGLAGCEAALQLANHGCRVKIIDAKPRYQHQIYHLKTLAELICNNSMGRLDVVTPKAVLINELKALDSKLIEIAERYRMKDSCFFAVDKYSFSKAVMDALDRMDVEVVASYAKSIPDDEYVIIATGAQTNTQLLEKLSKDFGIKHYFFSDASCPIVDIKTVNVIDKHITQISEDLYQIVIPEATLKAFCDYLSEQYKIGSDTLLHINSDYNSLETIESLAACGEKELIASKFSSSYSDYPCMLLRRESAMKNSFLLSDCTTSMRRQAQLTAFRMLPGLEKCRFVKYGRSHPNTFIYSPDVLNSFFCIKGANTYIVGQLSGVDDYTAAIASGWVASNKIIYGDKLSEIPRNTIIGGLAHYISNPFVTDFQPMCPSFAVMHCNSDDYMIESQRGIAQLKKTLSIL